MKYRKKPIEVEAFLFNKQSVIPGYLDNLPDWLQKAVHEDKVSSYYRSDGTLEGTVETLEGIMYISDGDYIIQGIQGELYPCKPKIFVLSYEPAGVRNSALPSQIGAEQMRLACGEAISKGIREGLEKENKEMANSLKLKCDELLQESAKEFNGMGLYKVGVSSKDLKKL
ncbi:hypothetical protein EP56_07600 [Listeriaceae bacterium FSL A5-0209]|nr:hypothetical protein EP56_07600 [Listeriaceae bacterium FSL A5-0209]